MSTLLQSSPLTLHKSCLPVHATHITSNVTLNYQLERTTHSKLEMGKNPHCSDSILFGLGSIPISKDILVWPTCRSIYVIGDVIADALGVDDVMSVTSRAFQPSGQPLTQRVQGPFTMKADARRRGRRRVARADVDVERDRGHAAGRRGRRGDRVHLAEHPRGWSCTLETRPKFCRWSFASFSVLHCALAYLRRSSPTL